MYFFPNVLGSMKRKQIPDSFSSLGSMKRNQIRIYLTKYFIWQGKITYSSMIVGFLNRIGLMKRNQFPILFPVSLQWNGIRSRFNQYKMFHLETDSDSDSFFGLGSMKRNQIPMKNLFNEMIHSTKRFIWRSSAIWLAFWKGSDGGLEYNSTI